MQYVYMVCIMRTTSQRLTICRCQGPRWLSRRESSRVESRRKLPLSCLPFICLFAFSIFFASSVLAQATVTSHQSPVTSHQSQSQACPRPRPRRPLPPPSRCSPSFSFSFSTWCFPSFGLCCATPSNTTHTLFQPVATRNSPWFFLNLLALRPPHSSTVTLDCYTLCTIGYNGS
jgi:hypothetical protein